MFTELGFISSGEDSGVMKCSARDLAYEWNMHVALQYNQVVYRVDGTKLNRSESSDGTMAFGDVGIVGAFFD